MAVIHESSELRNQSRVFQDRFDAGKLLGQMLSSTLEDGDHENMILLAIPMGGVPVAVEIQKALSCPLDLVVVRKIQIPGNTEAGFGAITQEEDIFLNEQLLARLHLSPEQIREQTQKVKQDLELRNRYLRQNRPLPDLEGRTVILVDDGLASGYTMKAAVYMAAKRNAARKIVAVPTATGQVIDSLTESVDEIYCPNIRDVSPFAVAEAYVYWHDLDEPETNALLSKIELLNEQGDRNDSRRL